jgi:hypothetical protein
MATPREFKMGTLRGLNTGIRPNLLAEGEASDNTNCDYSAGSIRGAYGPGTGIATTTSGHNFLFWAGQAAWRSSVYRDWGMNDAPTGAGVAVTYVTQKTSLTAATNPIELRGASAAQLGLPAPASAPAVSADATSGTGSNTTRQ